MEIPKPSEDDKQFFRSLIADDPEVEVKPMFGNLGAFVHGNADPGLAASWVERARDHVGELPPKAAKPKKARPKQASGS